MDLEHLVQLMLTSTMLLTVAETSTLQIGFSLHQACLCTLGQA